MVKRQSSRAKVRLVNALSRRNYVGLISRKNPAHSLGILNHIILERGPNYVSLNNFWHDERRTVLAFEERVRLLGIVANELLRLRIDGQHRADLEACFLHGVAKKIG